MLVGDREIDLVLPPYPFTRVVGHHPQDDGTKSALILDPSGTYWERVYSEEPPYEPIMFEIPASEADRFQPI